MGDKFSNWICFQTLDYLKIVHHETNTPHEEVMKQMDGA